MEKKNVFILALSLYIHVTQVHIVPSTFSRDFNTHLLAFSKHWCLFCLLGCDERDQLPCFTFMSSK